MRPDDYEYNELVSSNTMVLFPFHGRGTLLAQSKMIQTLCTWKQYHGNVYITLAPASHIHDFTTPYNDIFLVAFYLAEQVMFKNTDIRNELLKQYIPYVKARNPSGLWYAQQLIQSGTISFLFLQGTNNEFSKLFYLNEKLKTMGELRTGTIEPIIRTLLTCAITSNKVKLPGYLNLLKELYESKIHAISHIVYEIVSNTDRHGRRSKSGHVQHANVRRVSLTSHTCTPDGSNNLHPIFANFEGFLPRCSHILVISVFDSGNGIAHTYDESYYKEADSLHSERIGTKVVSDCFKHGTTTSKVPNSGAGLHYVYEDVKQLNGMLIVDTDRVNLLLYKNSKGNYIWDWGGAKRCTGTCITVLIPLA